MSAVFNIVAGCKSKHFTFVKMSVFNVFNGSPRVSQGVTLCGEWACRLTLSIAVSGSML